MSFDDSQKRTREGRYIISCIAETYFSEKKLEEAFENFNSY